jgi:hypothetical protein
MKYPRAFSLSCRHNLPAITSKCLQYIEITMCSGIILSIENSARDGFATTSMVARHVFANRDHIAVGRAGTLGRHGTILAHSPPLPGAGHAIAESDAHACHDWSEHAAADSPAID